MNCVLFGLLSICAATDSDGQLRIVTSADSGKGVLRIKVTDGRGNSLQGVKLEVYDHQGQLVVEGQTYDNGVLGVRGLDPVSHGNLWVRASMTGFGPVVKSVEWQLPSEPLRFQLGRGEGLEPRGPTRELSATDWQRQLYTSYCAPMSKVRRQVARPVAETCCKRELRLDPCTGIYYEVDVPYTVCGMVWETEEVWEPVAPQNTSHQCAPCAPSSSWCY